jgi:hypothetical protein
MINPLEELLKNVSAHFSMHGVDAAIVAYDERVGTHSICCVACPECSDYAKMATHLRTIADELDKAAMEREPCERHVKKQG